MSELKPCPFCGSPAEIRLSETGFEKPPREYVGCTNCACYILGRSGVDVIAAWNTRQEPKALDWSDCVELAVSLQVLSIELSKQRKGKPYDEWMSEIIPVEQELYVKAIHAALPSQDMRIAIIELQKHQIDEKDRRIAELEAEVEKVRGWVRGYQSINLEMENENI